MCLSNNRAANIIQYAATGHTRWYRAGADIFVIVQAAAAAL